jgi:hypothetical protein
MSIATLADIILKFRKLTGAGNSLQLTDAQIIDYINSFYLYDFPAQFRSLKLKDRYTFNTIRGIDIYPFDSEHYTTVEMPCYCMKFIIPLYQQPFGNSGFWGSSSNWQFQQNITQGNGTTGPYTGTLTNTPIVRSVNNNPMVQTPTSPTSAYLPTPPEIATPLFTNQAIPSRVQNILITANSSLGTTQNITDDGAGNLIGGGTGTINYETGAISVTFTNVVPSGQNIQVMYSPTVMARPLSILFFQNQFTLRPVPDQGYTIELIAYRQPSQALLGTTDPNTPNTAGVPELKEWWELLSMGAAKKFFEDQQDVNSLQVMEKYLFDRYAVVEARTYAQIGSKQRIGTIYADQMNNGYGGWGGSGYGGFGI